MSSKSVDTLLAKPIAAGDLEHARQIIDWLRNAGLQEWQGELALAGALALYREYRIARGMDDPLPRILENAERVRASGLIRQASTDQIVRRAHLAAVDELEQIRVANTTRRKPA